MKNGKNTERYQMSNADEALFWSTKGIDAFEIFLNKEWPGWKQHESHPNFRKYIRAFKAGWVARSRKIMK